MYSIVSTQRAKTLCTALRNQLVIDKRDCEKMRVPSAPNSVSLNKSNPSADTAVFRALRASTTDDTKMKPTELWQFEKRDMRIC